MAKSCSRPHSSPCVRFMPPTTDTDNGAAQPAGCANAVQEAQHDNNLPGICGAPQPSARDLAVVIQDILEDKFDITADAKIKLLIEEFDERDIEKNLETHEEQFMKKTPVGAMQAETQTMARARQEARGLQDSGAAQSAGSCGAAQLLGSSASAQPSARDLYDKKRKRSPSAHNNSNRRTKEEAHHGPEYEYDEDDIYDNPTASPLPDRWEMSYYPKDDVSEHSNDARNYSPESGIESDHSGPTCKH